MFNFTNLFLKNNSLSHAWQIDQTMDKKAVSNDTNLV